MSDPCLAVARAILGALDAPDGVLLKCGRIEGHEPPHRFLMEWTDPAPTSERSGLVTDQISAYLASRREDPALRARVKERIARDAEILRRLDDEAPDAGQRTVLWEERSDNALVIPNAYCPTAGCTGDPNYAAPGRGHAHGCTHPSPAPDAGQGDQGWACAKCHCIATEHRAGGVSQGCVFEPRSTAPTLTPDAVALNDAEERYAYAAVSGDEPGSGWRMRQRRLPAPTAARSSHERADRMGQPTPTATPNERA